MAYLVVEDNPAVAKMLYRFLVRFGDTVVVHNCEDARRQLVTLESIDGLVLDVRLPDGSGLDLLAELRRQGIRAPALVLTGLNDPQVPRQAQLHHALFLPKPPGRENLQSFVQWATQEAAGPRPDQGVRDAVGRLALEHRLSNREREILTLAALGHDRWSIAERLAVEPSTVRTQIRRLLRKTDASSLQMLVSGIHRRTFDVGAE